MTSRWDPSPRRSPSCVALRNRSDGGSQVLISTARHSLSLTLTTWYVHEAPTSRQLGRNVAPHGGADLASCVAKPPRSHLKAPSRPLVPHTQVLLPLPEGDIPSALREDGASSLARQRERDRRFPSLMLSMVTLTKGISIDKGGNGGSDTAERGVPLCGRGLRLGRRDGLQERLWGGRLGNRCWCARKCR